VLDLHDIYGNIYGAMDSAMPLLTDTVLQERFIRVWELLAQELLNVRGTVIMFELLNEVSDASGAYPFSDIAGEHYDFSRKESLLWNKLYKRCIKRIRSIDPDRLVLVGSNGQNSVVYLKELEILDDPAVFYNFHYYDPQVFTHQQAGFSEEMREFELAVGYPDDISGFAAYLDAHPVWKRKHALVAEETRNDRELMEQAKQMDSVLGAWNFGSETHNLSDDYSDVDIVLLVDGKQFDRFPFYLERCLENISAKIILCWPERFNSGAIINNGYLLLSGSNIFQFDVFLLNAERLDDHMCRLHYTGLQKADIIFDKTGMVHELMELRLTGNLWNDDVLYLEKTYWYHANMTGKYLKRKDYFS